MSAPDLNGRRRATASLRSLIAVARIRAAAVVLCSTAFVASCKDTNAPPGPPYLAIVTDLNTWPGAAAPARVSYRVRELSGTLGVDRRLRITPTDTVIISVPPASYLIEAVDLPANCIPRNGTDRGIVLGPEDNTGLVRYSITCRGLLSITALTDGWDQDGSFIYRVRNENGGEWTGIIPANDTIVLNDVSSGPLEIQLGGVAPNCQAINDGGTRLSVDLDPIGGAAMVFRIACSSVARRPRILSLVSGFTFGASIFTFRVIDPDSDLDGYVWDITDCRGNSILPEKRERTRRGLRGGRGALSDTLTVVGAFEVGLSSAEVADACTEIRVFDSQANISEIITHRIGSATGFAPSVRFFNARLEGTQVVRSLLEASDPEQDIVGHFVAVRLRDGALGGQRDGVLDLGIMDPLGYLGTSVVDIPTTGRIKWDDVYGVIVYLIDKNGNVVRVEDSDVFK